METQRGREPFLATDRPHGKRLTRKRLPPPPARFHQEIYGRVLNQEQERQEDVEGAAIAWTTDLYLARANSNRADNGHVVF